MAREIPYGHEVAIFSRAKGESAVAKAAYRAGARLIDQRTGEVHDFRAKQHVEHSEILAPTGTPAWVFDREQLWNQVEAAEGRKNSQVAREIRLTLPRELDRDQQIALVREWCKTEYVSQGMIADFAVHTPPASDDGEQPHAHVMLTMRHLDASTPHGFTMGKGEGEGREWNALFADKDAFKLARKGDKPGKVFVAETTGLDRMRAAWAEMENRYLAAAGVAGRVDHRSLKEGRAEALANREAALARGDIQAAAEYLEVAERLNRPPEPKLRPGETRRRTERIAEIEDLRSYRAEVIDLAEERRRRRQRRHPEDLEAALERPTAEQSQRMEQAHARLETARQQVASGAIDRDRRQDRRAHDVAGAAERRQPVESGHAVRIGATAGSLASRSGQGGGGAPGRTRRDHSPQAIARRRERARRIEDAKARMPTLDSGNQAARDRYKLELLQEHYQQQMPTEIAADLAWVRDRGPAKELVVQMRDGGRVRDDGAALRTKDDGTVSKFAVMAAAAKAHGWTELEVSGGSRAFRERSAEALTRVGITVRNAELAEVVSRTKQRMIAEAIRDDVAFSEAQLVAAEQRLRDHQRMAWDQEWTGPDGRRRPFTRSVAGMPQPVPCRMTDEEIRDHLQPCWSGPCNRLRSLESSLEDRREEYDALGGIARLAAGSKRAEIARLEEAIKEARREAAEMDRQWRQLGRQAGDLERQADRMREAALSIREAATAELADDQRRFEEMRKISSGVRAAALRPGYVPTSKSSSPAERLEELRRRADEEQKRQDEERQKALFDNPKAGRNSSNSFHR